MNAHTRTVAQMAHNNIIGSASFQDAYRRRWEAEVFKSRTTQEQDAKRKQRDDARSIINRDRHRQMWEAQIRPLLAKYPQPIRALSESTGIPHHLVNQILRWAKYEGLVMKGKDTRVPDNRGQTVRRPTWKLAK